MAWQKYTPAPPKGAIAATPVSIAIPERGLSSRPLLMLNGDVLKKLGWKAGVSLQIEIGEGEHAGKVRISPMAGEPAVLMAPTGTSRRKRSWIVLGWMPGLTEDKFKAPVPFAIDGTALTLTLPDEARGHQLPAATAAAVRRAQGK